MGLCSGILDAYREREFNVTCSYWGHLRELSEMIKPMVRKCGVDMEEWGRCVVAENEVRKKMIARQLGRGVGIGSFRRMWDVVWMSAALGVLVVAAAIIAIPRFLDK
jgi:hypothetical protein